MSISRVSNWFQGTASPSGMNKKRLASALGVDADWLYNGTTRLAGLVVGEEQAALYNGKRLLKRSADNRGVVALSPDFRTPPDEPRNKCPSRDQIEHFIVAYLDAAETWPHGDGLSVAWHEILAHLRPSDFVPEKGRDTL